MYRTYFLAVHLKLKLSDCSMLNFMFICCEMVHQLPHYLLTLTSHHMEKTEAGLKGLYIREIALKI